MECRAAGTTSLIASPLTRPRLLFSASRQTRKHEVAGLPITRLAAPPWSLAGSGEFPGSVVDNRALPDIRYHGASSASAKALTRRRSARAAGKTLLIARAKSVPTNRNWMDRLRAAGLMLDGFVDHQVQPIFARSMTRPGDCGVSRIQVPVYGTGSGPSLRCTRGRYPRLAAKQACVIAAESRRYLPGAAGCVIAPRLRICGSARNFCASVPVMCAQWRHSATQQAWFAIADFLAQHADTHGQVPAGAVPSSRCRLGVHRSGR